MSGLRGENAPPERAIPGTFTQEMASVNTKKVKYYYYTYTCPKCGKKYTLSELAK